MSEWLKPLLVALATGAVGSAVTWLVAVLASRDKGRDRSSQDLWTFVEQLQEQAGKADEKATKASERLDTLQVLVDEQRDTIRAQKDTIAGHERTIRAQNETIEHQTGEIVALKAQVAQLQRTTYGGLSDG